MALRRPSWDAVVVDAAWGSSDAGGQRWGAACYENHMRDELCVCRTPQSLATGRRLANGKNSISVGGPPHSFGMNYRRMAGSRCSHNNNIWHGTSDKRATHVDLGAKKGCTTRTVVQRGRLHQGRGTTPIPIRPDEPQSHPCDLFIYIGFPS